MMYPKNFKDYPTDTPLKHRQVEPGNGIIGCEMHEQMGWGSEHDLPKRRKKRGWIPSLLHQIFGIPK